jgi:16S rRNA processing protein RimM
MTDDWMLVGRVAGPFGVRGEIKIDPLTDFPDRFRQLESLHIGPDHDHYAIQHSRKHHGQILVSLVGVDSPEAVRELRGAEIYVPRSEAVPLPAGHFYLEDVLGLAVRTTDGAEVGTVTDVLKTGSNEVFVVGTGKEAVLIPVIKDAVSELNLDERRVVIEPWVLTQD